MAVALALFAAVPYPHASAQSIYAQNKIVEMVQTPVAPRIDGVLDEEIWADAAMVSDLHQMNPNGVRYEGLFLGASQMQWNWDSIWQAAATRDDEGWLAEMAIPFKTLSFDAENDT